MAEEKFGLPASSIHELEKIIKGYSQLTENADLDSLSRLLGMHRTAISGNNRFLTQLGIISGGKKKDPTETGKKLGRALDHNQTADIRTLWQEAIKSSEFLSNLVTTVRLKDGMASDDLAGHILYVSGQKKTKAPHLREQIPSYRY